VNRAQGGVKERVGTPRLGAGVLSCFLATGAMSSLTDEKMAWHPNRLAKNPIMFKDIVAKAATTALAHPLLKTKGIVDSSAVVSILYIYSIYIYSIYILSLYIYG
jgi:hypothetical protein